MQRTKEKRVKDVDGHEHVYSVTQFPAEIGFDLATEILEVVGESLGALASNSGGPAPADILDQNVSWAAIGGGLFKLAGSLQRKKGAAFIKRLLTYVVRDGRKFGEGMIPSDTTFTFSEAYMGNYGELLAVVAFVVEVNFASFFGGSLAELLAKVVPPGAPKEAEEGD